MTEMETEQKLRGVCDLKSSALGGLSGGARAKRWWDQTRGGWVTAGLSPHLGCPPTKASRHQAHPHWTRETRGKKKILPGGRVKKYFQHRLGGNWLYWLLRGQWQGNAGRGSGVGGIKRAHALRMPSALWRPVHTLKAKWTEELFFSWQWNKWPMGISGLIWPFGSNQWPRNQNSLVLISSRVVKIIGRGGLH